MRDIEHVQFFVSFFHVFSGSLKGLILVLLFKYVSNTGSDMVTYSTIIKSFHLSNLNYGFTLNPSSNTGTTINNYLVQEMNSTIPSDQYSHKISTLMNFIFCLN